jgi:hypothetical protein
LVILFINVKKNVTFRLETCFLFDRRGSKKVLFEFFTYLPVERSINRTLFYNLATYVGVISDRLTAPDSVLGARCPCIPDGPGTPRPLVADGGWLSPTILASSIAERISSDKDGVASAFVDGAFEVVWLAARGRT